MKRILLSILFACFAVFAKAMSYDEARQQAWFLTDKMAYELNLTPEQCNRAYQINLDYLMSVRTASDCTGYYWQYRDTDLRCILFDWQYNRYRTLDYFFRPVRWYNATWYYPVFNHYRHGYYYFDQPRVYVSYRGGMWNRRGRNTPSPYISMRPQRGTGMRDGYHRGATPSAPRPYIAPRPNTTQRPNNNYRHGNQTPNRGDNKFRPTPNRGSATPAPNGQKTNNRYQFRDSYTNYKQTGNDAPRTNRGTFTPNRNSTPSTPNRGRVDSGRSNTPTRSNGNFTPARNTGRGFGGR